MLAPLRKTLVDSHVAAVIVAGMLQSTVAGIYYALYPPLRALILFIQLYASHRAYRFPTDLQNQDSSMLFITLSCLLCALAAVCVAWLVSHWAYGAGPLRSLAPYRDKLTRKFHA